MKIDSALIGMDSARSYASETKTITYETSAGIGLGFAQGRGQGGYSFSQLLRNAEEETQETEMVRSFLPRQDFLMNKTGRVQDEATLRSLDSIREACIRYLIRWLYDGLGYREMRRSDMGSAQIASYRAAPITDSEQTAPGRGAGMPEAVSEYYHSEAEDTSFHTTGTVKTADGRSISFDLDLGMSRRFSEYTNIRSFDELPQMTDPLVINIDSSIASLSDQRFEFDIDADGIKDSIPMLESGSGYLALDRNGDGRINDGTELFGTGSGDGFADLSGYDSDGNGWIDENDEVFEKLLVWCKDPEGEDQLYTLKEAGVGAICLMKAETEFSLQSVRDNRTNGVIRQTGIFLYENGGVGTMQQLDLAQ